MKTPHPDQPNRFAHLATRELAQLADELQRLRDYAPLLSTGNGQYQGHILGFVKGLRISARLIYFIRKCLSAQPLQVSWGHIIDVDSGACSPECDVIIHSPGHYEKWNDGDHPIMEFLFVESRHVKGVISCKSILAEIDGDYPAQLAAVNVRNVILFAEACSGSNYQSLKSRAIAAGYSGLWCAYFTENSGDEYYIDENHHIDFHAALRQTFTS